MQPQFECFKIKDGLYLGNLATAQDQAFLQTNKLVYVINCSAETPNYFDNSNIKYLKFKLVKDKPHKLWDEQLKKLRKLQSFVEQAEDNAMCCLVFSANGNNRSLVLLVALLMDKYRWTLRKTLEYIRAKDVFIGLSEHYIGQLEQLQDVLSQDKNNSPLSSSWKGPYLNEEEEIISKTFINSQEINYTKDEKKVPNNGKRVVWLDKLDKEKKREIKEGRPKLEDNFLEKRKVKRTDENSNGLGLGPSSFSAKIFKRDAIDLPLKRVENRKSKKQQGRNISNPKGGKTNEERDSLENQAEINQPQFDNENGDAQQKDGNEADNESKQEINLQESLPSRYKNMNDSRSMDGKDANITKKNTYLNESELIKLIKRNLKLKENKEEGAKESETEKEVYRLTINNFIQPSINILSNGQGKEQAKHLSKNKSRREDGKEKKMQLQKEGNKSYDVLKMKNKPKRNTEGSPKRERKLQKVASVQYQRNQ